MQLVSFLAVAALLTAGAVVRGEPLEEPTGQWEAAPFMETGLPGLDSTHTFGFVLRGQAYAMTGNVRNPKFDYCGDCRGTEWDGKVYSTFTDVYYSYDPTIGWTDLGPHPGGVRGFSQGDIMDRGTDNEILYWGLGQRRIEDENGDLIPNYRTLPIYPEWGFDGENRTGEYGLQENRTGTPRLTDWWSFDGTNWKRLADFPGIGRTHPGVAASDGKVFVGGGFGELCPSMADPCTATSHLSDPRGRAGNLQNYWVYDVQTDTWEEVEPYPYPAHHPMHFGLSGHNDQDPGGAFFVAGHNGAIVYNKVWKIVEQTSPDAKYNFTWTEMAPLPGLGRVAGTQFSHNGYGYVLGGEMAANKNNLLDGFGNSGEYGLNASALREDHRSMDSNEFWKYSPQSNTWTQLPPTPDDGSRWAGSSFVLDDYAYCFQGVTRKGHYQFNNFTQVWPQQGYRMYIGPPSPFTDGRPDDFTLINELAFPNWCLKGGSGSDAEDRVSCNDAAKGEANGQINLKLFNPIYLTKKHSGAAPEKGGYPTNTDIQYVYEFAGPFLGQAGGGSSYQCPEDFDGERNNYKQCGKLNTLNDDGPYGPGHVPPHIATAAIKFALAGEGNGISALDGPAVPDETWFDFATNGCRIKTSILFDCLRTFYPRVKGEVVRYPPPFTVEGGDYKLEFVNKVGDSCESEQKKWPTAICFEEHSGGGPGDYPDYIKQGGGPHYCSKIAVEAEANDGWCPYLFFGPKRGQYRHPHIAYAALETYIAHQVLPNQCGTAWDDSRYPAAVDTTVAWPFETEVDILTNNHADFEPNTLFSPNQPKTVRRRVGKSSKGQQGKLTFVWPDDNGFQKKPVIGQFANNMFVGAAE